MKKALKRLRNLRNIAVDKMDALAKIETGKDHRELTQSEKSSFEQLKTEVAEYDDAIAELSAEPETPETPASSAKPKEPQELQLTNVDEAKLKASAARDERLRVQGIQGAVKQAHNLCAAIPESLAVELIEKGTSLDAARSEIFAAMEVEQEKTPTVGQHRAGIISDDREKFRDKMQAAILLRANPRIDEKVAEMGREYAGLSLHEMAREYLSYAGVSTKGMSRDLSVRIALQGMLGTAEHFSGGMHSTSDFPNILANVANKSLRMGYEAAPRTFTLFGKQVSATDFKPINRIQLSDISALRKVNEAGEFKRTTISDSKETYSLQTYGDIIAITRRVIINDDLDALTKIPRGFGVAAAQMESDVVWAVIIAGQTMTEDNTALYHATHGNLNTSNAFDDDGLAIARKSMRLQTGPKGTNLNLAMKYIMLPAALERESEQILNPNNLAPTTVAAVIPAWMRGLTPVIEPRLDADSGTTWYAAADPSVIDTIEYCYLQGEEGLTTEIRQGFDVDGVEIKAREDFAAAAIDFRGLQKNTA